MGKTIIVSSHILPELADVCNKIGIIERGELIVNANVDEVMRRVRQHTIIDIAVVGDRDAAAKLLQSHEIVSRVEDGGDYLKVILADRDSDYSQLATALITAGHRLTMFREEEINLETAFMELTKGITA